MPQLLSVSRAARLVSISRVALQKEIRAGKLETFEGKVRLTDLLRVHPEAHVEDNTMLEKVAFIKSHAKPSRNRDQEYLPIPEVLKTRLAELSTELVRRRNQVKQLNQFTNTLRERLVELGNGDALIELRAWVDEQLERADCLPEQQAKLMVKDTFMRIMSAHVKLIPSGHDFFVEGSESILEAALHAGLSVNFGCTSGQCGHCKARVLQGEVWKIREHEYELSDTEVQMGYMLMCCHTAVTDLTLEAQEALNEDDFPEQEIPARIHKCSPVGNALVIVDAQTPKDQSLRFMAGQAVNLRLGEHGPSGEYAVASCPCDGRHLQFHLRADDPLAQAIQTQDGEMPPLDITGPQGHFVLRDTTRPVVLIARNEGFAPIKSLMEHAIAIDTLESLHLFWVADDMGHYMNNLCRSWSEALEYFRYHPLPDDPDMARLNAHWIGDERLQDTDEQNAQWFIAGGKAFCKAISQSLEQAGVLAEQMAIYPIGP